MHDRNKKSTPCTVAGRQGAATLMTQTKKQEASRCCAGTRRSRYTPARDTMDETHPIERLVQEVTRLRQRSASPAPATFRRPREELPRHY
jgi:hypothetical protein